MGKDWVGGCMDGWGVKGRVVRGECVGLGREGKVWVGLFCKTI